MPEQPYSFWQKLGALTAFITAVAGLVALFLHEPTPGSAVHADSAATLSSESAPLGPSVSGTYQGQAFNKSLRRGGNVRLILDHSSTKLTGRITITGDLNGSGPIEGYTDGHHLGFTSIEQSTGISMAWDGIFDGSRISGTYVVSFPMAFNPPRADEVGEWQVSK